MAGLDGLEARLDEGEQIQVEIDQRVTAGESKQGELEDKIEALEGKTSEHEWIFDASSSTEVRSVPDQGPVDAEH